MDGTCPCGRDQVFGPWRSRRFAGPS